MMLSNLCGVSGMCVAVKWRHTLGYTLLVLILTAGATTAQTFNSGSTGADGALGFSASPAGTVIDFDPKAFTPALDADGDSVYHFTTITIPTGVSVRLRADKAGAAPIHWLATGTVVIAGTLDLNGEDGHGSSASVPRIPSIPGPGGFAGGIGGRVPNTPAQAGFGPGGGCPNLIISGILGGGGAHVTLPLQSDGCTAAIYSNPFLLPLVGGSGAAGGGAGGGAIMIASSVSINVTGTIRANGGNGGDSNGGGGSGGAIRLVAPTITGNGVLNTNGGNPNLGGFLAGSIGRIRIETFQNTFTGSVSGDARAVTLVPNPILLPTSPFPKIRIVSVGGMAVPANPRGSFTPVDVTLNSAQAVAIQLEAQNIADANGFCGHSLRPPIEEAIKKLCNQLG